jgi:4-amino-4-deoxy-L-arabinose transferase-like glycosyltransferase
MSFFGVYILLFSLLLLKGEKKYRPLYFLCLGVSMGVGVLTKTAAFLMLSFPLLSWFFLKENSSLSKLKLIIAAYIFPALSYWWLFSDPYAGIIIKKGRDLSMSFSQLLTFPLSQWWKNLTLVVTNWYFYLTLPFLIF